MAHFYENIHSVRMTDGKGNTNLQPKAKIPKDINAPAKPLTGYLRYLNDFREEAKKRHPNLPSRDLLKIMSSNWNALPPEKKEKYFNEAKEDNEKYIKEFEAYQKTDSYKNFQTLLKEQKEPPRPAFYTDKYSSKVPPSPIPNGKHTKKKLESSTRSYKSRTSNGQITGGKKQKTNQTNLQSHHDLPIFTSEFMEYNKRRETQAQELRDRLKEKETEAATLSKTVEFLESDLVRFSSEKARNTVQASRLQREIDPFKARVVEAFVGAGVPVDSSPHSSGKFPHQMPNGSVPSTGPLNADNLENYLTHLSRAMVVGNNGTADYSSVTHKALVLDDDRGEQLNEFLVANSSSTSCSLSSVRKAISKIFDMEGLS